MQILIIVTGGTFDKEYDMLQGTLYFKETHVREMLEMGRCTAPCRVDRLMMKDSLELTDDDRRLMVDTCKQARESHIVITHGTDTMTETAKTLADARVEKTIILTGAMIPYKFGSSDGFFNLGSAIAFAQSLPTGVYIAMNGQAFDWHKVRKNKETGVFETIG
jgi:L-asparaginase